MHDELGFTLLILANKTYWFLHFRVGTFSFFYLKKEKARARARARASNNCKMCAAMNVVISRNMFHDALMSFETSPDQPKPNLNQPKPT